MKKAVILLILSIILVSSYAATYPSYRDEWGNSDAKRKTELSVSFNTGVAKKCSVGFSSVAYDQTGFPKNEGASKTLSPVLSDSSVDGELKSLKASYSTYVYWLVSGYEIKIKLSWENVKNSDGTEVFIVEATNSSDYTYTKKTEDDVTYILYTLVNPSSSGSGKITVSTMDLIDEPYGKNYTLNLKLEAITV